MEEERRKKSKVRCGVMKKKESGRDREELLWPGGLCNHGRVPRLRPRHVVSNGHTIYDVRRPCDSTPLWPCFGPSSSEKMAEACLSLPFHSASRTYLCSSTAPYIKSHSTRPTDPATTAQFFPSPPLLVCKGANPGRQEAVLRHLPRLLLCLRPLHWLQRDRMLVT